MSTDPAHAPPYGFKLNGTNWVLNERTEIFGMPSARAHTTTTTTTNTSDTHRTQHVAERAARIKFKLCSHNGNFLLAATTMRRTRQKNTTNEHHSERQSAKRCGLFAPNIYVFICNNTNWALIVCFAAPMVHHHHARHTTSHYSSAPRDNTMCTLWQVTD